MSSAAFVLNYDQPITNDLYPLSTCIITAIPSGSSFGCCKPVDREKPISKIKIYIVSSTQKSSVVIEEKSITDIALCNERLSYISGLDDNWNGNGAPAFNPDHIRTVSKITARLPFQPGIFPTAQESVQLEYEKSNGEYLEFEIFEDRIEVFSTNKNNVEVEYTLGITDFDCVTEAVYKFYE